jgi:hypothetical protein
MDLANFQEYKIVFSQLCRVRLFRFIHVIILSMKPRTVRRLLALLLLLVSLVLLVWGLWPGLELTKVLPIPPAEMQLPTPAGWIPMLGLMG